MLDCQRSKAPSPGHGPAWLPVSHHGEDFSSHLGTLRPDQDPLRQIGQVRVGERLPDDLGSNPTRVAERYGDPGTGMLQSCTST